MSYSTTGIYSMKRKITNFSNKISSKAPKPNPKFIADISYGMLTSGSCLLTDIAD